MAERSGCQSALGTGRDPRSDLLLLVEEGVEGAIAGTALYEGRFTLEVALALTKPVP